MHEHQDLGQTTDRRFQISEFDGLNMSTGLATALRSRREKFTIHLQQLRGTQELLVKSLQGQPALQGSRLRQTFPMMDLPYVIRHLVLEHMIEAQTISAFLKRATTPISLPVVARAGSSLLRRECSLVALKVSTVEIHSGPDNVALQAWLRKIDFSGVETDSGNCQNGFDAINTLNFPYFSRFPYDQRSITVNHDVQLALACKHLRTLTLDFHFQEISRIESNLRLRNQITQPSQLHIAAAASIRQKYQLDLLLDAKQLQKIRLRATETRTLEVLSVWFVQEFNARGNRVVVAWSLSFEQRG